MQGRRTPAPRPAHLAVVCLLVGSLLLATRVGPVLPARSAGVLAVAAPIGLFRPGDELVLPDGSRVVCARPGDCRAWATALTAAQAALDPVLPALPGDRPATVVAPTRAGQRMLLDLPQGDRPAATTLVVDDAMVARGLAPAVQRGRTWIVVNPDVLQAGGALPEEVLTHELVHARTWAPSLDGPLWVEEGYAVALTHLALGPGAGPVLHGGDPGASMPPSGWPDEAWTPSTVAEYALAGRLVEGLAQRVGWDAVARWYAAVEGGADPAAAAAALAHPRTALADPRTGDQRART